MDWRTAEEGSPSRICFHKDLYEGESACCRISGRQTAKKDGCNEFDGGTEGNAPMFASFASR